IGVMSPEEARSLVDALAATPERLRELFGGRGGGRPRPHPPEGEWTPGDILLHMRASNAILAERTPQILTRPSPPLSDIDERAYAAVLARAGRPVAAQIELFAARRGELVELLRTLQPEQWELAGQHELRGPISIRRLATWIAEHEAEHLTQIEALR